MGDFCCASADHVADVDFGYFVIGQVDIGQSGFGQLAADDGKVLGTCGLQTDEDVGFLVVTVAVVELGDVAAAEQVDELEKTAALFGDGYGENAFVAFAQFAAFGNVAQAMEIHVGATGYGYEGLVLDAVAGGIGFQAGKGERACWFGDAAGVVEDVFDGAADGIGVNGDDVVQEVAAEAEGFFADDFDGGTVGEEADVFEADDFSGFDGLLHATGVVCLHADDFDAGADLFDERGNARRQSAAADGDEDGMDVVGTLAHDFHADRALSGNHVGVVKRGDVGQFFFFCQLHRVIVGIVVGNAFEDDFSAAAFDGVDFDFGRGFGHNDDGAAAQTLCRKCDALCVVARAGGDDAAGERFFGQLRHFVVRSADFEGKHGLQVFAFEQDVVVQTT